MEGLKWENPSKNQINNYMNRIQFVISWQNSAHIKPTEFGAATGSANKGTWEDCFSSWDQDGKIFAQDLPSKRLHSENIHLS